MMQYYRSKTTIETIIWYLVFGVLHELSHVVIASILLGPSLINSPFTTFDNLYQFILRAVLGRCWEMTINTDMPSTFAINTIRHFGWIFSVVIAMVTYHVHRSRNNKFNIPAQYMFMDAIAELGVEFEWLRGWMTESMYVALEMLLALVGSVQADQTMI